MITALGHARALRELRGAPAEPEVEPRPATRRNIRFARLGIEWDVDDLVNDEQWVAAGPASSSSRRPARCAWPRRATHSVAVANSTRCPAGQARIPAAIERWVSPVPAGG
jgi:hypothetical protein